MFQKKEIKSLTGIRGVAALYVAVFHSLEVRNGSDLSFFQIFVNHGYLSVDLFFVLSGFVMALSSKKIFENEFGFNDFFCFMKKRFARIYPMYFVVLCIGFAYINHFDGKINFIISLSLLSIVLGQGYVMLHMWSLSAEWIAYLAFPFFIKMVYKSDSLAWTLILASLSVLVVVYANYERNILFASSSEGFSEPMIPSIFRCFGNFVLGITAYRITQLWPSILVNANYISFLCAILILSLLGVHGTDIFINILFLPLVLAISTDRGIVGRFLASKYIFFLGLISYSLYLIHPILLVWKYEIYQEYKSLEYLDLKFNLAYIFLAVVIAYGCYYFIEIPVQKKLNGLMLTRNRE